MGVGRGDRFRGEVEELWRATHGGIKTKGGVCSDR